MSLNREIVSFRFVRSCVRARGLDVEWNSSSNPIPGAFPFPFWPRRVFPFPFYHEGLSLFPGMIVKEQSENQVRTT